MLDAMSRFIPLSWLMISKYTLGMHEKGWMETIGIMLIKVSTVASYPLNSLTKIEHNHSNFHKQMQRLQFIVQQWVSYYTNKNE